MTVTVSQSHFKNSPSFYLNHECPLALAIKSIMSSNTKVNVGGFHVHINNDKYVIGEEWLSPLDIMERIDRAKNNEKVEEVTVTLTKL